MINTINSMFRRKKTGEIYENEKMLSRRILNEKEGVENQFRNLLQSVSLRKRNDKVEDLSSNKVFNTIFRLKKAVSMHEKPESMRNIHNDKRHYRIFGFRKRNESDTGKDPLIEEYETDSIGSHVLKYLFRLHMEDLINEKTLFLNRTIHDEKEDDMIQ